MELTNIIFKDYLKTKKIILHDQFSYFCSDDYFDYFRSTNHRILANRIHKLNNLAHHGLPSISILECRARQAFLLSLSW